MDSEDGDWTLDELRRAIQKGLDDLDAGRGSPGEEVFARLRSRRLAFQEEFRKRAQQSGEFHIEGNSENT